MYKIIIAGLLSVALAGCWLSPPREEPGADQLWKIYKQHVEEQN